MNRQETLELLKKYLLSHDLQEQCPHGNSAAMEVHQEIIKLSQ